MAFKEKGNITIYFYGKKHFLQLLEQNSFPILKMLFLCVFY